MGRRLNLTLAVLIVLLLGSAWPTVWQALRRDPAAAPEARPAAVPAAPTTDRTIASLQARLRERPDDARAFSQLGAAYLQKVRETGDPAFYPKAEAVLNQALALAPDDFEAMISLGTLALARHQFREALPWAERARAINPYRAAIYGVIGDAHLELGEYSAAFDAFQQMMDRRPDLNSYARVSYARELTGDSDGAIAAMRQAAEMGAPTGENAAWVRVQLGNLYFNYLADPDAAEAEYQTALRRYPGYVYATAGLARVRAARGDNQGAIDLSTKAVNVIPLPEFVIALGDLYQVTGQPNQAARQFDLVRVEEQLYQANGVDTDLEMALFDADHQHDLDQALHQIRAVADRRPSVKAADVLAWTLYQTGDYPAAGRAMQDALRLGTRDPLMLFHAGAIAARLGDPAAAEAYLSQALALNPHFSPLYADQAQRLLDESRHSLAGRSGPGGH